MRDKSIVRSPLFYVGDKYKIISDIRRLFPADIDRFIEPFVGGGSVFMNVRANEFILNDIDSYIIRIHQMLCANANNEDGFFDMINAIIDEYGFSCSSRRDDIPDELKTRFVKTYFAEYNRESFGRLKADFNNTGHNDIIRLYLLLIYGFNRMLRFNRAGDFNIPVGNVDFNLNTVKAIKDYFEQVRNKQIAWHNLDFRIFFEVVNPQAGDMVYLDPPYLITFSEYNKLWNDGTENDLLNILNELNERGVHFAISNVTHYKGRVNNIFLDWSQQYNVHNIKSNYISYHDNTIKKFNEVLVTNY